LAPTIRPSWCPRLGANKVGHAKERLVDRRWILAIILICFAAVAVVVRVCLHFLDRRRIAKAVLAKGWSDVWIRWSPFARGWLWERGERHCRVMYADGSGRRHDRHCKTSVLTGVVWRDDPA
jgi:hypothetical protein